MTLINVLKFLGWVFAGIPILAFLSISIFVIWGAAKDDEIIMAIALLGITVFVIGAILLLLVYLTDLFDGGTIFVLL